MVEREGGSSQYKTLEPGPYWPLTGKAHTTCKAWSASVVALTAVAIALRLSRVAPSAVEGSAGIVESFCRKAQTRWPARVIYLLVARHQCLLRRIDR